MAKIGIIELKGQVLDLSHLSIVSMVEGHRKYGDRWKTTNWSGVKAVADSKWDMFLELLDRGNKEEIEHHAGDIIGWITILTMRAKCGMTLENEVDIYWKDCAHYEEIQEDCFLRRIDEEIERGNVVTAMIPKPVPEGILDLLLGYNCRVVIE